MTDFVPFIITALILLFFSIVALWLYAAHPDGSED